jgi:hypothetical protein
MIRKKMHFAAKPVTIVTLACITALPVWAQKKKAAGKKENTQTESTVKPAIKVLKMVAQHKGPVIGADHTDVNASNNKSGFETGQVVKINGVYHMFVNEMFIRPHRDMRISYWTSPDAATWKRQSTVVESVPGRISTNPRAEVWCTGVVFNEEEEAWNIFYVAYRAGDSTKGEIPGNDYAGRIWRAKSIIKGRDGIAGPYADMGVVMEPDSESQEWEGQQAVACFNPYKVGNTWFSPYDGHNHTPRGPWPTGLAFAPSLNGPWKRMPEPFNPIQLAEVFTENEIVTRLKDGRYLMIFDSFGDQEIGYSLSKDGIHWDHETRVKVQTADNVWADPGDHAMRTPLCAIEEEDGTFTVVYTAKTQRYNKNFYAIGKCILAWQ